MPNYFIMDGDDERCFVVETLSDGTYRVTGPEGDSRVVDAYQPQDGRLHLLSEGRSLDFDVRENDGTFGVQLFGHVAHLEVLNERQKRMRAAGVGARGAGGPDLVSPMAGRVVAVQVDEGANVEEGEVVVIVEAMKMENDLKAHKAGVVAKVHVAPGDAVEIGDTLVTID